LTPQLQQKKLEQKFINLFTILPMFTYLFIEIFAAIAGTIALAVFILHVIELKETKTILKKKRFWIPLAIFLVMVIIGLFGNKTYAPSFAMPAWMHTHAPEGPAASLPFFSVIDFFKNANRFEKVDDIGADPNAVPPATNRTEAQNVYFELTAKEVIAEVADGISFNYWTYNGQTPGPMLRARVGDTITLKLTNDASSLHDHNIDLHAVTGPGGGAAVTHVAPGESKTFTWKALNPGLYIYHCAMPNVSTHNSHGQYGLILIEPLEGMPAVDKEFYLVQGELYTQGKLGKQGLVPFDSEALLDGIPNYVTFNGKIESTPRMSAEVGDTIRVYVGNGGVNLISSFHLIGEIFDRVYPEAAIGSDIHTNVQTTTVLPGGASIVEFTVDVPGKYLFVDHALARMNKGAWAVLDVEGEDQPEIYHTNELLETTTIHHH